METFSSNSRNLTASYHIFRAGHGILNMLRNSKRIEVVSGWRAA